VAEKTEINFPAIVDVVVCIVNDETMQYGTVTLGAGMGSASNEKIIERIKEFQEEEIHRFAPGFRVATNREFFDSVLIDKTGTNRIHMPGIVFGEDIDPESGGGFFDRMEMPDIDDEDFDV
jgi:hypothetical protein